MFSNWFLKSFRILLFPFSIVYAIAISIRNLFYDKGWFQSASFGLPVICVGNLAVGGTGKSPMVEYLVSRLRTKHKTAILSRGYKRKTRGYLLAGPDTTSLEIGDEPMQFHTKFPDVPIAVGEERLVAIPQLLHDHPETELVILDDAFQHRAIRAGLNILLTDYSNLYTRDLLLPAGDLRDSRSSAKRAHLIIVTKCPAQLTDDEKEKIIREIKPLSHQSVFFTTIDYGLPYHLLDGSFHFLPEQTELLLVTGIANPQPLKDHLALAFNSYQYLQYADHHLFTIDDWKDIKKRFDSIEAPEKAILTTEKDATRLMKFRNEINGIPFYVLPIEHRFLFNGEHRFNQAVTDFIQNFEKAEHNYNGTQE